LKLLLLMKDAEDLRAPILIVRITAPQITAIQKLRCGAA
jgi:hypothetical protein